MLDLIDSHSDYHLLRINTVLTEYGCVGSEIYTVAMLIIKEEWDGEVDSLDMYIVRAVVNLVYAYCNEYDRERLISCLRNTENPNIISNVIMTDIENPSVKKFIKPLLKIYNGVSPIGLLFVKF